MAVAVAVAVAGDGRDACQACDVDRERRVDVGIARPLTANVTV
jgi:hypothetical protein